MQQLNHQLGANDSRFNHQRPNNPDQSKFPLSRITNITADPGQIIPFDWFKVYPGDRPTIGIAFSLDTLPLVQPPLTRYKVIFHAYYMKARDCWKGAKTMTTRGRSGNVKLTVPRVDLGLSLGTVSYKPDSSGTAYNFNALPQGKHSLGAFLGVPSKFSGIYYDVSEDQSGSFVLKEGFQPYTLEPPADYPNKVAYTKAIDEDFNLYRYPNALPFMMYQNICRNNYVNANLLQESTAIFPEEGDDDWMLPYNATVTNFVGEADNTGAAGFSYRYDGVYTKDDTAVRIDQMRYSLFDDDYFISGMPWLQRGDAETMSLDISDDILVDVSDAFIDNETDYGSAVHDNINVLGRAVSGDEEKLMMISRTSGDKSNFTNVYEKIRSAFAKFKLAKGSNFQTDLTANKFRELLALSVFKERNAKTDGSYNAMIFQHWRVNPHSEEHHAVYIGGTADYVSFTTILQNSMTVSDSPLGSTAGMASNSGAGQICNSFYCEDYGYIMIILQIKPDTTYMQGVEFALSRENTFEDLCFPEFEKLGPQSVLVKELYVCDNDTDNEDLFNYQEPFTYAKVRQNQNRGYFQTKPEKDRLFGSFTQARWFAAKPEFSYQFCCMQPSNMRRDWLSYPAYPAFRLQIASNVMCVRSLAYMSEPETFGF